MKNKILLLEDDESLRRAVSLKLSKENYMVYEAADIKTAAALYQDHLMPLIICDINLPDGSGLDFCSRIRAKSNVFFLFLTAFDTETDMIKGYEAGADDYMTKPFSLAILISKVNPMRILSKNQLLTAIWDIDGNFVDENTLAVNIRRLREKIEDDPSNPAFLKNVRGLGYIWERNYENL